MLVYDITDRASFETLGKYVEKLSSVEPGCSIIIIGSKLDLVEEDKKPRAVQTSEAASYANEISAKFFETSSKTGHNIENLLDSITELVVEQTQKGANGEGSSSGGGIVLESGDSGKKGCCKG
eukprot:TRINITY_DN439_c0_g2_i3.p3 TRINITY_DN439_c0_g2~~TRINITY_DN439_c0_g2_i3.p3  ORF type:complete len:123 (-),score=23.47 TRINITY_DN439_c0_g2_i3:878-1246(-)